MRLGIYILTLYMFRIVDRVRNELSKGKSRMCARNGQGH